MNQAKNKFGVQWNHKYMKGETNDFKLKVSRKKWHLSVLLLKWKQF